MPDPTLAYAAAAAKLLHCLVDDLLAYRWDPEDQQFIVIAPSGQKHRFEIEQLEAALEPPAPPPEPTPPPAEEPPVQPPVQPRHVAAPSVATHRARKANQSQGDASR